MRCGLFEQRGFGSACLRYRYHVFTAFYGSPYHVFIRGPSPLGCVPGKDAGCVIAGFEFSPTRVPGLWVRTGPVGRTGFVWLMPVNRAGLCHYSPIIRAGLRQCWPVVRAGLCQLVPIGAVFPSRACTRRIGTVPCVQGQIVVANKSSRFACIHALSGRGGVRVPWRAFTSVLDILFIRCV